MKRDVPTVVRRRARFRLEGADARLSRRAERSAVKPSIRRKDMNLKVVRKVFTEDSTIGELSVDGRFECFTLEDKVRAVGTPKVWGATAIPEGIYEVIINFSEKFQKFLPLLLNVPNFSGIRIHSGNTSRDTTGCILVGQSKASNFVGNSKAAFAPLFAKMQAASKREKIFIQIVGGSEDDVALGFVEGAATAPTAARGATGGAKKISAAKKARRASKASGKKGAK
jgi:hypothetical protein